MEPTILVVDDDPSALAAMRGFLISLGYHNIFLHEQPEEARESIVAGKCIVDLVLLDVSMPGLNGINLLETIKETCPDTECIMVSGTDEAAVAVSCLKKGAYDYLVKPVSRDTVAAAVRRALERRRLQGIVNLGHGRRFPSVNPPFQTLITQTTAMLRLLKEAELHASSDVPVLITGDTGTGKELLAKAIHQASPRADRAFLPVNMAALTGSLFESEFFGHLKGAFTGATLERSGYLEACHRGTLFLDEIGDLPWDFQSKLLRVLENGEFIKLGSDHPRNVDVRVIAATNADLEERVSAGEFRRDLYYRLHCAHLQLPGLAQRREDIPLLAKHFLTGLNNGAEHPGIEETAMHALLAYDYPGNVRELHNILHSACNRAQGRSIALSHLPAGVRQADRRRTSATAFNAADRLRPLTDVERDHILFVYRSSAANKTQTAKVLGIGLNTLRRRLKAYGVE